jgi:hypothetical protein
VDIAIGEERTGLATWTFQDGTDAHATTGADAAVRRPTDTAYEPSYRIVRAHGTDRGPVLIGSAIHGAGRILRVTVERQRVDPRRRDAFRLRAATGVAGRPLARGRVVATGPQMLRATLAANARGDAAVAWWERARHSRLFVAVRRRGHAFGTPQRLAASGFGDVAVATGPRGDVLVAWESHGVIRTRTRTPHGRRFGAPVRVTATGARGADLEAGLSRRGRAVVGWGAQRRSSGGDTGRISYAAAIRRPGGRRFAVMVFERQPPTLIAQPVALAVEPSGRATFAWTGYDGTNLRVRAVDAVPGARFSAPQDLSAPGSDAWLGDVAGGGGRRVAAWTVGRVGADGGRIEAAFAGPAQPRFGPPEVVTDGGLARVPRVAFDPVTWQPTVVWSERPALGDAAPGVAQTVARAATRAAG